MQLDDVLQQTAVHGVMRLSAEEGAFSAVGRHATRRASQIGRRVLVIDAGRDDAWRELARQLAVPMTGDPTTGNRMHPVDVGGELARALTGYVLVVCERRGTAWGHAVGQRVAHLAGESERRMLLVRVRSHQRAQQENALRRTPRPGDGLDLDLELGHLTREDARRWWSAVVSEDTFLAQPKLSRLGVVDQWWEATRHDGVRTKSVPADLSPEGLRLLCALGAAEQALTPEQLAALERFLEGTESQELERSGLVHRGHDGSLWLSDGVTPPAPDEALRRALAEALSGPTSDGWSLIRAAELLAPVEGELEAARDHAFAGLRAMGDVTARRDLWERWEAIVEGENDARRLSLLVRSAELALSLGDGDRADVLARAAMGIDAQRFDVLLLHGRSSHARGDVTAAALSLTRALQSAGDDRDRARAAGLLSQARYMAGDRDLATKYAQQAIDHGVEVPTRLEGRNVLGKLLLAQEAWLEAEKHFAEDAYEAATAGLREAELRARLNRAIAVLYLGRRDEARAMLDDIRAEGERRGVPQAVAFALSNLAAIAILKHEYAQALELSERAIDVRRRIGDWLELVVPMTNLAELRLRLGLIDEAEQGLRLGLNGYLDGLPSVRYAHIAKVIANVHLERGQTALAAQEVATAISGASGSGEHPVLADCYRLSAAIALEDGDIERASTGLDRAAKLRQTAFGEAELAVLRTRHARAAGRPYLELARVALDRAQDADDPESLREAHVLLVHALRDEGGDEAAADSHLQAAVAQRERVSATLPADLRAHYLKRRALTELAELERGFVPAKLAPVTQPVGRALRRSTPRQRLLVGDSPAMRALRATVQRVAATDATVLIQGPTGSGKELVAEAVHRESQRQGGPLVKVNCAALVETLLLSELFGHERGAFTGASSRRRGRFELAEGGTLFLDEIGDISARTQVALLRVLQDGTFERVGGTTQLRSDVRVVCATHRDLKAMVETGEFREDLYYRLCGMVVEVPSLKERLEDLADLSAALLVVAQQRSGIRPLPLSEDALRLMQRHDWPGNVRELENALRAAALFASGEQIEAKDVVDHVESLRHLATGDSQPERADSLAPPPSAGPASQALPAPASFAGLAAPASSSELVYSEVKGGTSLADMKRQLEKECITRALMDTGGNITKAAKVLGMKRPRLSQLVKQYELAKLLEEIKS